MLREQQGGAGIAAVDLLEGQGLGRVEEVDESVGPCRDDAHGLLTVRGEHARARRLDMVKESLEDAPRLRVAIAGELTGDAWPGPRPLGAHVPRQPLAKDAAHHLLERLAPRDLREGARRRLTVIGQDVEIITALGQPLRDAQELADGVVDVMQGAKSGRMGRSKSVSEHVVVEEVDVYG